MERVIVIDDEADIREEVSFILSQENFEVSSYENGQKALEAAQANPDEFKKTTLLIVDIMMPELSGTDMIALMGQNGLISHIPVLFLSALGDDGDIIQAHKSAQTALTVDYLRKPFQTGWLLARIKNIVKLKKYHDELEKMNMEMNLTNLELSKIVNEKNVRNEYLTKLSKLLDRDHTESQQKMITAKDLFRDVAINDLPLVKFVGAIIERSRTFIEETVTGSSEEEEVFRALPDTIEALKTVSADLEQAVNLLISMGMLDADSVVNIDLTKTSFYEKVDYIYQSGGISTEFMQALIEQVRFKPQQETGDIDLF